MEARFSCPLTEILDQYVACVWKYRPTQVNFMIPYCIICDGQQTSLSQDDLSVLPLSLDKFSVVCCGIYTVSVFVGAVTGL